MAIEKLNMNWKNKGETGAIPINATNLNKMSNKTDELVTGVNGLQEDSGTKTIGNTVKFDYRKIGNVCMMRLSYYQELTIPALSAIEIGTLPEEYRPVMNVREDISTKTAVKNEPFIGFQLLIDTTGLIRIQNWSNTSLTSGGAQTTVTYLTN